MIDICGCGGQDEVTRSPRRPNTASTATRYGARTVCSSERSNVPTVQSRGEAHTAPLRAGTERSCIGCNDFAHVGFTLRLVKRVPGE